MGSQREGTPVDDLDLGTEFALEQLRHVPPVRRLLVIEPKAHLRPAIDAAMQRHAEFWDMSFANDETMAQGLLGAVAPDVVILPVGAASAGWLEWLGRNHPTVLRVLAASGDPGPLAGSVDIAHQLVAQPYDLTMLLDQVDASLRRRDLLESPAMRVLVGGTGALPSPPTTYLRLTEVLRDPDHGVVDLARVIERDPAIAAKSLQLVNSAWYGVGRQITSMRQAAVLLGGDALRGLVLSAEVSRDLGHGIDEAWLAGFERRAGDVASAALVIAEPRDRGDATAAALLHDVGELILAAEHLDVLQAGQALPTVKDRLAHEKAELGATHQEVGAALLAAWGLPESLIDATALHHTPRLRFDGRFDLVGAIHVADALVGIGEPGAGALAQDYLAAIGALDRVEGWELAVTASTLRPGDV